MAMEREDDIGIGCGDVDVGEMIRYDDMAFWLKNDVTALCGDVVGVTSECCVTASCCDTNPFCIVVVLTVGYDEAKLEFEVAMS